MKKKANNHADFARCQREAIIKKVTGVLLPKLGHMCGYEPYNPYKLEIDKKNWGFF
ncbi:lactamase [Escherichia coli]|nr:lactamase [Escherichia coli]